VRRVVYASSSSVYGDRPDLPKREDQPPAPISPYAVSKTAGEQYAAVWHRLFGLETVGLRYFNVFGPRQDPASEYAAVIPRFILWGLRGEPLQVHGDGEQSRDFTYVGSVANVLADAAVGQVGFDQPVNLAFGSRVTLLEVIAHLESILGHPLAREHLPVRPGDVRHSQADQARFESLFPAADAVPLADGLARTVEWFRSGRVES
jgi:UDP-glucose 4-epimerase